MLESLQAVYSIDNIQGWLNVAPFLNTFKSKAVLLRLMGNHIVLLKIKSPSLNQQFLPLKLFIQKMSFILITDEWIFKLDNAGQEC